MLTPYQYPDRSSWSHMTVQDAHTIQYSLARLEFRSIFAMSMFFALFKTYSIPSISKLLVATGRLSNPETTSKRIKNISIIITKVVLNKPGSEKAVKGIARMNYLHGRYIKAGKISNDDMLYTLSLFALEPIRWTAKFGWRSITDFERCAIGVYWKDLGEALGIHYHALSSATSGWRDGLHWLKELEAWRLAYEARKVVPAKSNATFARSTLDIALSNVPTILKPYAFKKVCSLLDTRFQTAMK